MCMYTFERRPTRIRESLETFVGLMPGTRAVPLSASGKSGTMDCYVAPIGHYNLMRALFGLETDTVYSKVTLL